MGHWKGGVDEGGLVGVGLVSSSPYLVLAGMVPGQAAEAPQSPVAHLMVPFGGGNL